MNWTLALLIVVNVFQETHKHVRTISLGSQKQKDVVLKVVVID
jgi:hypothetical protein